MRSSTSHPDHVIGTGKPASCTSAAVVKAVASGGVITFNCGPSPVTITMSATAKVVNTSHQIVLDGGGKVTLSGAGKRQILYMNTCDKRQQWTTSDCYDQEWPDLVVQNMTFEDGNSTVKQSKGTNFGGGGGGAIFDLGGQLKVVNSRFIDNRCYHVGPDLGGAAVRALAQWRNKPVYITSDTFRGGQCSNGGALSSIGVYLGSAQQPHDQQRRDRLRGEPGLAGHPRRRQRRRHLLRRRQVLAHDRGHGYPRQSCPRGRRCHLLRQ